MDDYIQFRTKEWAELSATLFTRYSPPNISVVLGNDTEGPYVAAPIGPLKLWAQQTLARGWRPQSLVEMQLFNLLLS